MSQNNPNIIFVVASGNHKEIIPHLYPHYLLEKSWRYKIIDPATSAYSITVGSIAQNYVSERNRHLFAPKINWPSPFTCVGPGLNGMIKPEFVEWGGNTPYNEPPPYMQEHESGVILLNPNWRIDNAIFTTDYGSSFSAPVVSNYIARLWKEFPNFHSNTIKAFLLASSEYPESRPEPLDISINSTNPEDRNNLLNIYGYGKPNIAQAVSSEFNHVQLFAENRIHIDGVHFYIIDVPRIFFLEAGEKEISVTIVYNPKIRRRRIDYMGTKLEFKLFKNTKIDDIKNSRTLFQEEEDGTETFKTIILNPPNSIRSNGIHQKGFIKWINTPSSIDPSFPLILGVYCKGRWMKYADNEDYLQDYSVVFSLRHHSLNNLYDLVKERIPERIQPRV